ncbi:MAG TPA: 1-acyl-sn-glycerol-3-phosphate acyltransferase [Rubricoccaceae bacterium]|nr:1-acyl-sn-glycerol-3-phosphate acyltransferase [Rubricoccaceae bacterium]
MTARRPPLARLARRAAGALIVRDLKRSFRRVVWVGPPPSLPDAPVVLYANHHGFHDGYLLWLLAGKLLRRETTLWMEEWRRVPLFGPLGTLPFPPGDARQRVATLRETARRMKKENPVLVLFPEGALRPPDAGLGPFRADLPRLARVLPAETRWWPVALRATWWGEDLPTALLTAGPLYETPDGQEPDHLRVLLTSLQAVRPDDLAAGRAHLLLDGRRAPHERFDLSALAPLFRRWT